MLLFCQKSFYKDVFGVCVSALVWLGRVCRCHSVCAMAEELRQGRMLLWNDWTCNTSITALKTTSRFNMVTSNTALEITSSLIQHGKLWLPREQPEFQALTLTLTLHTWRDLSVCQCCPTLWDCRLEFWCEIPQCPAPIIWIYMDSEWTQQEESSDSNQLRHQGTQH